MKSNYIPVSKKQVLNDIFSINAGGANLFIERENIANDDTKLIIVVDGKCKEVNIVYRSESINNVQKYIEELESNNEKFKIYVSKESMKELTSRIDKIVKRLEEENDRYIARHGKMSEEIYNRIQGLMDARASLLVIYQYC